MKTVALLVVSLLLGISLTAQNTDLPGPGANLQTLPTGSYVIAMDNTNQLNSSSVFNYKTYGLAVHLLNNAVKLKWVIKAGKVKDGIDFTVNASPLIPVGSAPLVKKLTVTSGSTTATLGNASGIFVGMYVTSTTSGLQAGTTITAISGVTVTLSLPATATISNKDADFINYTYPVSSYNFRAGPFVIYAADTTGVGTLIKNYNNSLGANDKIKVYKTAAAVTVDIRYDMNGFKPKANILNDGNNSGIHVDYMINCGITSTNYTVGPATDLYTRCYTFASEPHNSTENTTVIHAIKSFVQNGGNFLAQCMAIETYENSSTGRFQTTNGVTISNTNIDPANTVYPNPDLAYSQMDGAFDLDVSGSCKNWTLASGSSYKYNAHNHATGGTIVTQTPIGASVSKLTSSALPGGLVYYLGSHNFDNLTSPTEINGLRMYMNAFLTPVAINSNCAIGEELPSPLPVKLLSFNANLDQSQTKVNLTWSTAAEINTSYFIAERSIDGSSFTEVGRVAAGGNTAEQRHYQFTDLISTIKATVIYYRLRQVDIDGDADFSSVRIVRPSKQAAQHISLLTYPNPATNELRITLPAGWQNKRLSLEVLTINGQALQKLETANSSQTETIDISKLAPGFYLIRASCDRQVVQQKIIKH